MIYASRMIEVKKKTLENWLPPSIEEKIDKSYFA